MCGAQFHCVAWSEERNDVGRLISLAGAATSIILFIIDNYVCRDKLTFVATKVCLLRQKRVCREKSKPIFFVCVSIKICLSRQKVGREKKKKKKNAAKDVFCREKDVFVAKK